MDVVGDAVFTDHPAGLFPAAGERYTVNFAQRPGKWLPGGADFATGSNHFVESTGRRAIVGKERESRQWRSSKCHGHGAGSGHPWPSVKEQASFAQIVSIVGDCAGGQGSSLSWRPSCGIA